MPSSPIEHDRYDALVVGARCAGAATAMLLARSGLRVLVVDRGHVGSDTVSTHALMRGGVTQLHRWGLLDAIDRAGTPRVERTTFHYGSSSLAVPIKPSPGVPGLYAPRRTVLDRLLAESAASAGAEVHHGMRVVGLTRGPRERVTGAVIVDDGGALHEVHAEIVVGADGMHSKVAELARAPILLEGAHGATVDYAYFAGLDLDGYHWHYTPGLSAGAIPTNGGLTCIFVAAPPSEVSREHRSDRRAGFYSRLARVAPELAARAGESERVEAFRRYVAARGFFRLPIGPGWALVGDAGYFKDPITAHGITDALRDAELLARAILDDRPASIRGFSEERDALSLRFFEITDAIASLDWSLDELAALHRAASDEMKREVRALSALGTGPARSLHPTGPSATRPHA